MKRGELWWAMIDKRRPVVLISRDEAYDMRTLIVVAPVTTTVRGYSVELRLGRDDGLPIEGVVSGDWLATIKKDSIVERIGSLSQTRLVQLDDVLRFALAL